MPNLNPQLHILEQLFFFLELAGGVRINVLIDSGMVLIHCSLGRSEKRRKKKISRLTCASKEERTIGQTGNNKYQLTKRKRKAYHMQPAVLDQHKHQPGPETLNNKLNSMPKSQKTRN
jgi:hypothetical protein